MREVSLEARLLAGRAPPSSLPGPVKNILPASGPSPPLPAEDPGVLRTCGLQVLPERSASGPTKPSPALLLELSSLPL